MRACSARTARRRVGSHPLGEEELLSVVFGAWDELVGAITPTGVNLVSELGIAPRAIGDLLEKLIARGLAELQLGEWHGGEGWHQKDVVCVANDRYSFEIKTSTRPSGLDGNKCYAPAAGARARTPTSRKSMCGYYLVVNYEDPRKTADPRVRLIRFGWLDREDWVAQGSALGQRSRVPRCDAERQLVTLYENS